MRLDVRSAEWGDWKPHLQAEIAAAQSYLEAPGLDPITTERLRGQILAFRSLLDLEHPDHSASFTGSENYGLSRPLSPA